MFKEVVMYTNQLKAMEDFYCHTLELPLLKSNNAHFTVKIGTSKLTFKKSDTNGIYHFAFNIAGNHFLPAKQWVSNRVTLNAEKEQDDIYYKSFDADAFYFNDPVGNVVEYIARRSSQADGEFGGNAILNLSEMSITTNDLVQVSEQLKAVGVEPRNGKPLKEDSLNFLGTDPTYIILVPPNRKWYFSTVLSEVSPLEITFTNDLKVMLLDNDLVEI